MSRLRRAHTVGVGLFGGVARWGARGEGRVLPPLLRLGRATRPPPWAGVGAGWGGRLPPRHPRVRWWTSWGVGRWTPLRGRGASRGLPFLLVPLHPLRLCCVALPGAPGGMRHGLGLGPAAVALALWPALSVTLSAVPPPWPRPRSRSVDPGGGAGLTAGVCGGAPAAVVAVPFWLCPEWGGPGWGPRQPRGCNTGHPCPVTSSLGPA
jgi:hypothetical protein